MLKIVAARHHAVEGGLAARPDAMKEPKSRRSGRGPNAQATLNRMSTTRSMTRHARKTLSRGFISMKIGSSQSSLEALVCANRATTGGYGRFLNHTPHNDHLFGHEPQPRS